ncbi:glycosyltransferase family 15 protein [Rhodotorula paludigena]|uniref:glycosyltransferase family 15 protein n=1 Tax=Rhodotorula paludigena TaxID=86838 RepID=UPI00316F18E5
MSTYAPLPTSAHDAHSSSSRSGRPQSDASLLSRVRTELHVRLSGSALAHALDQVKPRTARVAAYSLAALVLVSLVGLSIRHGTARESALTGADARGRWGSYASWLGDWSSGRSTGGLGEAGSGAGWRDLPENEGLLDPPLELEPKSGLLMPPEVYPAALNPFKRANAAIVALVRNNEREAMRNSMRSLEARWNRRYGYPWVFLNDEPFDEEFKVGVKKMTRSEVFFATIPKEHWGYPDWVNQTYAAEERQKMVDEKVIYGGSESYRHMCRFNSGFFYEQKVLESFDWYWRVEPGVEFWCDIDYDPFIFMEANNKVYGFVIALYEYRRTVETLWDATREFARLHPEYIAEDNAIRFLVDDERKGLQDGDWNNCHFWSNFEIASLKFWRSKPYREYFKFLDDKGGFFYERWGDAPVHSFGAALFAPHDQIHNFWDISYRHNPYSTCPKNKALFHDNGKCECYVENSFDEDGYSCMPRWWKAFGKPAQYE